MDFTEFIEWLEFHSEKAWDYVERESNIRIRFDWMGCWSFWVNDDLTIEGSIPDNLKEEIEELDISITYIP